MNLLSLIMNIISLSTFIFGICLFFSHKNWRISTRLLFLTMSLIGAIFCTEIIRASTGDERLLSLVNTMRIFSLNANYEALSAPSKYNANSVLNLIFTIYRYLLYTLAPIVGGFIIYDIIAGISPYFRLFTTFRKPLYIFSELNLRTLLLAEDIANHSSRSRIIFTNCLSKQNSNNSDLRIRAKKLQAICLEEDILYFQKYKKNPVRYYFLLNQTAENELDDVSNLIFLQKMLDCNFEGIFNRHKYSLFMLSNNSETIDNVNSIYEKKSKDYKQHVELHIIREYAQNCCFHLQDYPLYQNLCDNELIDLVILGWNKCSFELFKSVFWLGQMLNHSLRITVISSPHEHNPISMLESNCPELLSSCIENNECLLVYPNSCSYAAPYASLCFVQEDLSSARLEAILDESRTCKEYGHGESYKLKDANRFFIIQEKDDASISLANQLMHSLNLLQPKKIQDKIISVYIENDDYAEIIQQRYQQGSDSERLHPLLTTFGSFKQRYNWNTFSLKGLFLEPRYDKLDVNQIHSIQGISATSSSLYNEWSDVARVFHTPVKMACVNVKGASELEKKLNYYSMLKSDHSLLENLSWLEHRRWCAFTRCEGYTRPYNLMNFLSKFKSLSENGHINNQTLEITTQDIAHYWFYSNKDVPMRTHPCLVESSKSFHLDTPDHLDIVSSFRDYVKNKNSTVRKLSSENLSLQNNRAPSPLSDGYDPVEEQADSFLNGLKKYDSPLREHFLTLSDSEVYKLLLNNTFPTDRQNRQKAWNHLQSEYPSISKCRSKKIPDRYYLNKVLSYLDWKTKTLQ